MQVLPEITAPGKDLRLLEGIGHVLSSIDDDRLDTLYGNKCRARNLKPKWPLTHLGSTRDLVSFAYFFGQGTKLSGRALPNPRRNSNNGMRHLCQHGTVATYGSDCQCEATSGVPYSGWSELLPTLVDYIVPLTGQLYTTTGVKRNKSSFLSAEKSILYNVKDTLLVKNFVTIGR